jgi:TolB-like protein
MFRRFISILAFLLMLQAYLFAAEKKIISVLYFANTAKNTEYQWLSKGLADMLISDIGESTDILVVEREELNKVLEEQKLSLAGFTDEKNAARVGELLNAAYLVTGSFIVQAGGIRIDAKIIDTRTGEINPLKKSGEIESLMSLTGGLALDILNKLTPNRQEYKPAEEPPLEAMKYYYQGVDYLDSGDAIKALEYFKQSARIDPLYQGPQKGLEQAYAFLKDFKMRRYQRELNGLYEKLGKLKKALDTKPYKNYADLLTNSDWVHMTQEERDAFNRENEIYISYATPSLCTLGVQDTLMQIIDRINSYTSGKWSEILDDFGNRRNALEKEVRESEIELEKRQRLIDDRYNNELIDTAKITNDELRNKKNEDIEAWKSTEFKKIESERDELDNKYKGERASLDLEKNKMENDKRNDEESDREKVSIILKTVFNIAENSRRDFAKDKFLPNILYYELVALYQLRDYKRLKECCESFLTDYPDYISVWAVEDFYKKSLDELKNRSESTN